MAGTTGQPWDVRTEGEQVLMRYESTTLRMPREEAARFGLAIATACTNQSRGVSATAPKTITPSASQGQGRKPSAKRAGSR